MSTTTNNSNNNSRDDDSNSDAHAHAHARARALQLPTSSLPDIAPRLHADGNGNGNQLLADNAKESFPIICEPCLGNNPYMRMTTQEEGMQCKICTRPFKTYRWLPGVGMRYRRTEICTTCARLKNVCQTCLLDLEYGLSMGVRDQILASSSSSTTTTAAPTSGTANHLWYLRAAEDRLARTGKSAVDYARLDAIAKGTLAKLSARNEGASGGARSHPYERDTQKQKTCPAWLKGKCRKGRECTMQHQLPSKKTNDPKDTCSSANSHSNTHILERHKREEQVRREQSTTLHVANIPDSALDAARLTKHFAAAAADENAVRSVVVSAAKHSAFVNFHTREMAEAALGAASDMLDDEQIIITWGKHMPSSATAPSSSSAGRYEYATMNPSNIV